MADEKDPAASASAAAAPEAKPHGETLLGGAIQDQEAISAAVAGMSAEDKAAYEALTPEAKEAKHKEFVAAKRKPAEPDPAKKAADEAAAAAAKAEADKAAVKAAVDAMSAEDKAAYEALTAEQKAVKDKEILDAKAAEDARSKNAPEKYADFKLPQGMTLDKAATEKFTALAKELNLPQEAAQKLVDLQVEMTQKQNAEFVEGYKAQVKAWQEESLKELGAEPEKKLALAAKAMNAFATKELVELLESTGLGQNKEIIKFCVKIGEKMAEDSFPAGKPGAGDKDKKAEDVLYK